MNRIEVNEILNVIIELGRMMLSNGAETYRVEDTIYRVGKSLGLLSIDIFVVPTAIIITAEGNEGFDHTELVRVNERSTNLEMVERINSLSRKITASKDMTPNDVRVEMYKLNLDKKDYKIWQRRLGAGITTGAHAILFNGALIDVIPAFIIGGLSQILFDYIIQETNVSFFAEMLTSTIISVLAVIVYRLGLGANLDSIIIGSVMILVPGVAITNGLRDLMAGHLLAGVAVLAKALLTAAAIGIGVAIVLTFV